MPLFSLLSISFPYFAHDLGAEFYRNLCPSFSHYLTGTSALLSFLLLSFFFQPFPLLRIAPARERRSAHRFTALGRRNTLPALPAAFPAAGRQSLAQVVVILTQFSPPLGSA